MIFILFGTVLLLLNNANSFISTNHKANFCRRALEPISASVKIDTETFINDVDSEGQCDLATEGTIDCSGKISQPKTVWTTFSELATQTNAVNLGQGFPDWEPPSFVLDSLRSTIDTKYHQYTRAAGHPPLVELISKRYSTHLNRNIDAYNEVAITVGASQALFLTFLSFLKPGDEIVLLEPFFELYLKQIRITGAIPKFVSLGGKEDNTPSVTGIEDDPWSLDLNKLESAMSDKTKMIILNSPHNPTGKVFSSAEMEGIASIIRRFPNVIVVSDEVYKYSIHSPIQAGDPSVQGHYHFARIPGMWDRTITISSCGKTFSVTGWQVGWLIGPSKFVAPIQTMLPLFQFCTSTPIQQALTQTLIEADKPYMGYPSYYDWQRHQYLYKKAMLETALHGAGIETLPSQGGFFVMGKLPRWPLSTPIASLNEPYDWKLCRQLCERHGVVGIPGSVFFSDQSLEEVDELGGGGNGREPMARFAFCKLDSTLEEAQRRLLK